LWSCRDHVGGENCGARYANSTEVPIRGG